MEEVTQTIANTEARTVPVMREKRVLCRSSMGDIVASPPCFGKAVIRIRNRRTHYPADLRYPHYLSPQDWQAENRPNAMTVAHLAW
jgi:hypothetical protein